MAKVRLRRAYQGMPQGAQVGDEIDVDDVQLDRLTRDGNVERISASALSTDNRDTSAAQKAEFERVNQQRDRANAQSQQREKIGSDDSNR